MKVLADCHHGDLYESLRILFEDRFGWELYRPIGLEWYHEGYWHVFPHINTAGQYLGLHLACPPDVRGQGTWLNKEEVSSVDGVRVIRDHNHRGRLHRAIELIAAKRTKWDLIVSSLPQHFTDYERFRRQYCPSTPHVFQFGNVGWSVPDGVQNLLNSTSAEPRQPIHMVRYHQEFSLDEFNVQPCRNPRHLTNLMHYQHVHYLPEFEQLAEALRATGWEIKNYGAGNADSANDEIAEAIHATGFVWHCKRGGDGYGHNIFNSFACGRPMVVRMDQYKGLLAEELWTDGETVINAHGRNAAELAALLESASKDYDGWSQRVQARFAAVVDFNAEFQEIRKFLTTLR